MVAILARRRVSVPVVAALAVLGLAIFGEVNPGGWMVIDGAFDHWTYAGGLAGVSLTIAAAGIRTRTRPRRILKIVGVLVLIPLTLDWIFLSSVFPQDLRVQQQIPAPGGHPYRLVIAEGSDLIDTIWTLAIRTGSGITAREWRFGCLNGDDPQFGLASAAWNGPTQVVVMIGDEEPRRIVVPIDAATGRPTGTANTWDGCSD